MTWWRHQTETFSAWLAFVRGIHRSTMNSPNKGQRRGALVFSLIFAWTNSWAKNGDAGDLSRHRTHYDVIAMEFVPIGDTVCCRNDDLWCHRWWRGCRTGDVLFTVVAILDMLFLFVYFVSGCNKEFIIEKCKGTIIRPEQKYTNECTKIGAASVLQGNGTHKHQHWYSSLEKGWSW